ncbi:MAG: recombinase RecT [Anaerolineae bacterium]|nr:recombinase RecT [Anaerolineae bacterium]
MTNHDARERATRALRRVPEPAEKTRQLGELIDKTITQSLAKLLTPNEQARLRRAVLNLLHTSPDLLSCDHKSIICCVLQAAYLNLDPSPALGHVYFVPFEDSHRGVKEAQLLIGYKGWMELAYRSGQVTAISAQVIRSCDEYQISLGTQPQLIHVPKPPKESDDVVAAYAVAKLEGAGVVFDIVWRYELEKIRERSRAAKSPRSPWNTDFEAMCRAKAIRRLVRWLPKTLKVQEAVTTDELVDAGISLSEVETEESLLAKIAADRANVKEQQARNEEHERNAIGEADSNREKPERPPQTGEQSHEPGSLF